MRLPDTDRVADCGEECWKDPEVYLFGGVRCWVERGWIQYNPSRQLTITRGYAHLREAHQSNQQTDGTSLKLERRTCWQWKHWESCPVTEQRRPRGGQPMLHCRSGGLLPYHRQDLVTVVQMTPDSITLSGWQSMFGCIADEE